VLPYFCIEKKLLIMNATILLMTSNTAGTGISQPAGYAIGAVIAVLILGYLLYSLIKPEKF